MNRILGIIAAVLICFTPACSTFSLSEPANVQLTTQIVVSQALYRGITNDAKRAETANKAYILAKASRDLLAGQFPDPVVFTAALKKYAGNDPTLGVVVAALGNYYTQNYAGFLAKNPKTIATLEAIARGIEAAAQPYLTPSVTTKV